MGAVAMMVVVGSEEKFLPGHSLLDVESWSRALTNDHNVFLDELSMAC
jgi:hypothetical protein